MQAIQTPGRRGGLFPVGIVDLPFKFADGAGERWARQEIDDLRLRELEGRLAISRLHVILQRAEKPSPLRSSGKLARIGREDYKITLSYTAFEHEGEAELTLYIVNDLYNRPYVGRETVDYQRARVGDDRKPLPVGVKIGREFFKGRMFIVYEEAESARRGWEIHVVADGAVNAVIPEISGEERRERHGSHCGRVGGEDYSASLAQ